MRLLPVSVSDEQPAETEPEEATSPASGVTINIEFPGRTLVSVEGAVGADKVSAALLPRLLPFRWPTRISVGFPLPNFRLTHYLFRCVNQHSRSRHLPATLTPERHQDRFAQMLLPGDRLSMPVEYCQFSLEKGRIVNPPGH